MANKNTKLLRKSVRLACKAKLSDVAYTTPVYNYHSHRGSKESFFVTKSCPTAIKHGDGINSISPRRNMRQRIYTNEDNLGGKSSVTCHEPIDAKRFVTHKNHGYMVGAYKQTMQTSSRPAVV